MRRDAYNEILVAISSPLDLYCRVVPAFVSRCESVSIVSRALDAGRQQTPKNPEQRTAECDRGKSELCPFC